MDRFQKYSRLMIFVAAGFVGFILLVAVLFLVLRLFSATLFHIPGFDLLYQYIIIIIPYILFFLAYYYLYKKIRRSASRVSRITARLLIATGCLLALVTLGLSTASFFHVKHSWQRLLEDNSQYPLIIQVLLILVCSGVIASGDVKEKDWMDRRS